MNEQFSSSFLLLQMELPARLPSPDCASSVPLFSSSQACVSADISLYPLSEGKHGVKQPSTMSCTQQPLFQSNSFKNTFIMSVCSPEEGTRSHYEWLWDTTWLMGINSWPLEEQPVLLTAELSLQPMQPNFYILLLCAYMYNDACLCVQTWHMFVMCAYEGQTLWSLFSLCTFLWVPGIGVRLAGIHGKCPCLLKHLTSPRITFVKKLCPCWKIAK